MTKEIAPKRSCLYCTKKYSASKRNHTLTYWEDKSQFRDGRYIGNRPVHEEQHNRVVFVNEYWNFKYGNFCSLRCGCNHANSTTNANYMIEIKPPTNEAS